MEYTVEGLYCKRPIQRLASSEILTPPPPNRSPSVYPPPLPMVRGDGHTRWGERGWGINCSEDARHCSVLYICKYFVGYTIKLPIFFVSYSLTVFFNSGLFRKLPMLPMIFRLASYFQSSLLSSDYWKSGQIGILCIFHTIERGLKKD
jgi:hypothetical protein